MKTVAIGLVLTVAVLTAQQTVPSAPRLAVDSQARSGQATLDRVDAMVTAELAKDGIAGVTVGIVSGPTLVWTRSYGLADVDRKIAPDANTLYRIGSITKPFTALAVLQLVERGAMRLSDPVEKYVPELARVQGREPGAPPITIVQLATMTSGLGREPDDMPRFLVGPVSKWKDVTFAALAKTKYDHPPGTQFLYSNIGYAVLGAAVEQAAGKPYTAYVTERIFSPLGMRDTVFEPNDAVRVRIAAGYAVTRDGKVDAETPRREHAGRGYKVPNGAVYTTVGDLGRYVSLMLGHGPAGVIKKELLDDNFTRVGSASGDLTSGYGIGFQVSRRGTLLAYGHGGSVAGYNAAMQYSRDRQLGVIVLRNAGGGKFNVGRLCLDILATLDTDR